MKSCHQSCIATLFSLFLISELIAQDQRAFNQNAARSNRGLSISFAPLYSSAIKSDNDSLLFRGSGAGFRFGADYFMGKAGISFSSGFSSSSADDAVINNFLKRSSIPQDQLLVTKSRQQNMYLLLGPSVRFGNMVEIYAHAKGGLFINNSGLVNIQQNGAIRTAYRNESTGKSAYPGFVTGLNVQYKTRSEVWAFGIGADYMNTRSEVNNYDARRGGGMEALKLSRNITDIVTGITVRYNILSPRDHASGQASGKRQLGKPKYDDIKAAREAGSGQATGRRGYQPGKPVYGNITSAESCGPVTQKITHPDGSTEEMTFACPDDAAAYNSKRSIDGGMPNRISMNATVPKQTQGATFGEKVNAGLQAAGGAEEGVIHRDLAARNIISGRLGWTSGGSSGIVTNKNVAASSVANSGGGASSAAYAATGRMSNGATVTTLYAREAGSGIATGRRSREAGSGQATGRRQYELIFAEGEGDICNPCLVKAKMSGANSNPLYDDKGLTGNNPLYQGKAGISGGGDDDCDGIAGISVMLVEPASGAVIARTATGQCGDFFFANVPDGNYIVRVSGSFSSQKGYDVNTTAKTDLLGKVEQSDGSMQLLINSGGDENDMTQKAGISTSRSNIRSKSITIIEADLDGDGEFESLRATATFSDGTTEDVTTVSNAAGDKGIVVGESAFRTRRRVEVLKSNKAGDPNANRLTAVAVSEKGGRLTATGTFSDGSTRDISNDVERNISHPGVRQYTIVIGDLDGDGAGDAIVKTKTKSNQSNDRIAAGDLDDDGIWSPRSNIKMLRIASGDVSGDGRPDLVAGNLYPDLAVSREPLKGHFENGDIPTQARPGNPIGGLTIKGGKNPGGNLRTAQTNEDGEFEFTGLEAGDYTFTVEQRVFIEDETYVTLENNTKAQDHNSSRSNKTASVISSGYGGGNAKVQDHNSSRSNKSASVISNEPGTGNTKVQDHNSSRSNKTASSIAGDPGSDDAAYTKSNVGPVKWMAPEALQKRVNTGRNNIKNLLASLDDLEEQLDTDRGSNRTLINTTRGNLKNHRLAIYDLRETLADMEYMEKETAVNELNRKVAAMNMEFLALEEALKAMGGQYTSISNVLKTKHDTAKNAIGNIR